MSMNIYIKAERKITFKKKNGKRGGGIQTEKFNAVQTPTKITYEIVGSSNPIQAYKDYVKTLSDPEKEPVYADDDIWGERGPIGFKNYDWAAEHIERFDAWLTTMEDEGYTVKLEVI